MRYRFLIAGGLVLAMIALCGGMVLSLTNIGAMIPTRHRQHSLGVVQHESLPGRSDGRETFCR